VATNVEHLPADPAGPTGARPRRTQAERVEAMRERLLDATLDLLAERGWAEVSTNDVVRHARVSRGALAHHFPSKAALMEAAARRVIEQKTADFEAAFDALAPDQRTVEHALDLLWSYFQGPDFAALLELIVAARTNPDLREVLADAPERIIDAALAIFFDLFPRTGTNPDAAVGLRATFAMMTGMAVNAVLDEDDRRGHNGELLEWLKFTATMLVPETAR
jgi:AcrR family transcriptional regulator